MKNSPWQDAALDDVKLTESLDVELTTALACARKGIHVASLCVAI